jgi:hypothetical protein
MNLFLYIKLYNIMKCTTGEEKQYMCEGKEGIELKTYPIGVDIVEVGSAICH